VKILIIGGNGLLGQTLFFYLYKHTEYHIFATIREPEKIDKINSTTIRKKYFCNINLYNNKDIEKVLVDVKPDILINCSGVLDIANNHEILSAIKINTNLPHLLCALAHKYNFRLIHISTDGVFDGSKGNYSEQDKVKISDIYGMSKYLGEVVGQNILTIRTSIIGHNYYKNKGIVDWLLNANKSVNGYTKYIYSGLPAVELSRIIVKYIFPNEKINGLYHIASLPISKFEILKIISTLYNKPIKILRKSDKKINRSLNCSKFSKVTGYKPHAWDKLIYSMKTDYEENIDTYFS
jgi:dTDP-4-dehydrorhamnose reductase